MIKIQKERKDFKRYAFIDSLRGFAVMGVLLAHTGIVDTNFNKSWLYNVTMVYGGPRGVQLFFVVSAFTLYLSWKNRKDKEQHALRNFYIRRFFRIAPLFYIAFLYFLFSDIFYGNPSHFSLENILTTVFFVNGAFPQWINNIVYGGWTITVEMTFYSFFPFIVSKLSSVRASIIATFITMIVAQIIRLCLNSAIPILQKDYSSYTFQFFPSQLPVFLIGITTFLLISKPWTSADKKFIKAFTTFFVFLLIFQFIFKLPIIAGHYLYGAFFGGLLYFLSVKPIRLFVNAITIHIGKVSYSIYLCHVAVLYILAKYHLVNFFPNYTLLNFSLRFLLLLICSTVVATILFYLIEKPGQILGKRIIDRYEKTPTNEVSVALKTW